MLAYATLAVGIGAFVVWWGPPGTDLAAHLYQRTLFLRHGFSFWNNFWYAGRYSFVTYSFLYYPLAAAIGLNVLAVLTAGVAAGVFGLVLEREWGTCTRWASWLFAVVISTSLILGTYPYTLGVAFALLSLFAVQTHRFKLFALFAFGTLASSPLAFALLLVVLTAAFIRTRRFFLTAGVPFLCIGLGGALMWRLFPGNGRFPFEFGTLAAALVFCATGVALTRGVERARVLCLFFGVYGLACVICYLVPSDVGSNVVRLRFVAVPVFALALSLRRWKPLLPAAVAIAFAASWNATPLIASFDRGAEDPSASARFWAPAIDFLHEHRNPSFRVEAVDTSGHWEAVYLPNAGIAIVRGWYRQDDFPTDAILYRKRLDPAAYLGWLRRMAVRYVVLTRAPPDYSSSNEARLLESGRSGLPVVLRTANVTIFAVPSALPMVRGPAHPRVVALRNSTLTLDLSRPGTYRLALRYTPYWSARGACIRPTHDGMVSLTTGHEGIVQLNFAFGVAEALDVIAGDSDSCPSVVSGRPGGS